MKNISLLILMLLAFACNSNSNKANLSKTDGKVSYDVFQAKMTNTASPQLIDVRTPEEFGKGSLEEAINMDFRSKNLENQLNTLNKTKPVFIFCQSGGRSGQCYQKMKEMGFLQVYDLDGGYGSLK